MAVYSKVFRKASLSLYIKEQFSRLAKSAASNIFSYFVSFGYTGERLIPGLRRKDWILRALLLEVTSLWLQKVGSRGEIYSARWKLVLISDRAKHKNASWEISVGDFALESLFCAQSLWILNLVFSAETMGLVGLLTKKLYFPDVSNSLFISS